MQAKDTKAPSTPSLPLESMLILDQCALIEQKCAELYHHFATLHPELPELVTLWKKTALEEENHARQLRMLSRMKGEGIVRLNADRAKVAGVLQKLNELFEQVKASAVAPADTLRLGIKLEQYLSDYHANSVAICGTKEMTRLLNAMMKFDLDHVARLERALGRLTAQQAAA